MFDSVYTKNYQAITAISIYEDFWRLRDSKEGSSDQESIRLIIKPLLLGLRYFHK